MTKDKRANAARLIALSPHEPVSERLDALKELATIGHERSEIARELCKSETCPSSLKIEALALLEGSDEDDLACALACAVPTGVPEVQELASKVARAIMRDNFLEWLEERCRSQPERHLLLALWSYCTLNSNVSTPPRIVPLTLLDLLVSLTGSAYLKDSISKSELMGSLRTEALAALCIRSLGVFCTVPYLETCLENFNRIPGRSSAVNLFLKEMPSNKSELVPLALCQALEHSIRTHEKLVKWNETWFYQSLPDTDEAALKTLTLSLQYSIECLPLLSCLERWIQEAFSLNTTTTDTAVASRIGFILASWCATSIHEGIALPWVTEDCALIARRSFSMIRRSDLSYDCEELRKRLGKEAWKSDWTGSAALLYLTITAPSNGILHGAEFHLLPMLLPLADDFDPRIAAPAWHAIRNSLSYVSPQTAPVLFRAIERGLAGQDVDVYTQVTLCLDQALSKFDKETEHDTFIERMARDTFYSANSQPVLYSLAVKNALCPAVARTGVFCIRMLPQLLQAIQAGAQKRATYQSSLALLEQVLVACAPRIKAHRGDVFAIVLKLAAVTQTAADADALGSCVALFRAAVKEQYPDWVDEQVDQVRKIMPALADKII